MKEQWNIKHLLSLIQIPALKERNIVRENKNMSLTLLPWASLFQNNTVIDYSITPLTKLLAYLESVLKTHLQAFSTINTPPGPPYARRYFVY